MIKIFTLIAFISVLVVQGQQSIYQKQQGYFEESRGDAITQAELVIPLDAWVRMELPLNSTSGLGALFNYHGMVLRVNQMNPLPNGDIELVLEREDNRDFFDLRPYIKAIVRKTDTLESLETSEPPEGNQ